MELLYIDLFLVMWCVCGGCGGTVLKRSGCDGDSFCMGCNFDCLRRVIVMCMMCCGGGDGGISRGGDGDKCSGGGGNGDAR